MILAKAHTIKGHSLFVGIFCLAFFNIEFAKAQIFPNTLNQDQVSRMEERQLNDLQIEREKQNIERRKNLIKGRRSSAKKMIFKPSKCFKTKKFEFNENELISLKELENISSKYLDKCFDGEIISDLREEIYKKLNEKGYVTSQAVLPQQNISQGLVKIEITPGKINSLTLNEDKTKDRIQKFMLFGDLNGKTLDIKDVNQGLHQMNKLQSSNAKVKILPSENDGYSDLVLKNERANTVHAKISHDNLGNDFTGEKRTTFSSTIDGALSLSELIDLSFTNNLNDSNSKKEMESVIASISIPFRYYTLSYNYSDTDYMGKVDSQNGQYTINGYSRRKTIGLERSIINERLLSLSVSSLLTIKDTGSETLLGAPVSSTRKRLSILNLSLSLSKSFEDFSIYVRPSLLQGLRQFNADQDPAGKPINQATNQFRAYRMYLSITKPIKVAGKRVVFSSEFNGQLSKDALHGSEQFSIGDYYSVRGFRENYISGDHGYYLRNKMNVNLGVFAPRLYNISIEPFFDYGAIQDKVSSDGGRLSGAGINGIYNSRSFDASVTYSRALGESKLANGQKKEDHAVYFQVTFEPF